MRSFHGQSQATSASALFALGLCDVRSWSQWQRQEEKLVAVEVTHGGAGHKTAPLTPPANPRLPASQPCPMAALSSKDHVQSQGMVADAWLLLYLSRSGLGPTRAHKERCRRAMEPAAAGRESWLVQGI